MSPRKVVKNPKLRALIAWTLPLGILIGATIWLPAGPIVWGVIGIIAGGAFALIYSVCFVIALIYWVRTGYITNPLRHGPWGDWKRYKNGVRQPGYIDWP